MAFPSSPSNGDIYQGYQYNATTGAWKKIAEFAVTSADIFSFNSADISTGSNTPVTQATFSGYTPGTYKVSLSVSNTTSTGWLVQFAGLTIGEGNLQTPAEAREAIVYLNGSGLPLTTRRSSGSGGTVSFRGLNAYAYRIGN